MDQIKSTGGSRRIVVVAALVVVMAVSGTVSAQQLAHSQFIPVVARNAGVAGTQWVTDVSVYNATDETLTVGTQFLPADQANLFDPSFPDRFTLGPYETRVFVDVLHELFGYDSELKGSLLFTVDSSLIAGNPDGAKILAATRIYNTGDPAGTYGQTVPALSLTINAAGTPSVATGVRHDSSYRSNLGIASLTLISDITVHYRVRTEDGSVLREGSREIQPSSMSQWSFQQLGVPVTDGPLTVELWLDPSDVLPDPCATNFPNMFIAYVSKVDGGTGDAEFIYAAPTEPYDCPRE